jgi:hypothetical protein
VGKRFKVIMSNKLRYYPPLIDLVDLSSLEGTAFNFVKEAIEKHLSKLYYKDFQFSKGADKSSGFYSLKVVSNKKIEFSIPGTDVSLIINKAADDNNISAFPISLNYNWNLLKILKVFNSNSNLFTAFEDF